MSELINDNINKYDLPIIHLVPPPKHLIDCINCSDEYGYPHQKMHHSDKDGHCMLGELLGKPCQCLGFSSGLE